MKKEAMQLSFPWYTKDVIKKRDQFVDHLGVFEVKNPIKNLNKWEKRKKK